MAAIRKFKREGSNKRKVTGKKESNTVIPENKVYGIAIRCTALTGVGTRLLGTVTILLTVLNDSFRARGSPINFQQCRSYKAAANLTVY